MDFIDFRSDTVTRPSPPMREAMARAEVGDDVFGDDPTVNRLQERVAELLGKEAGLFVPSGTMANQISLGSLCRAGDEIICEEGSHCINYESGALAALWGIQAKTLIGDRGLLDARQVDAAVRVTADHFPRTALIEIENTHNRGGGTVYPLARVREIVAVAEKRKLPVYLDGARLFNAVVASGVAARDYAAGATLVSICLSKGLGAPAGSVVCGSKDRIADARRLRKRLGGAMRQAGILAAAGLYALDHNIDRLADDHANAKKLASGLAALPNVTVRPVETNIVFVSFGGRDAPQICARMREAGVLALPEGSAPDLVRFLTHLDVPVTAIDEALRRIAKVV